MLEIGLLSLEGGGALNPLSLPLSVRYLWTCNFSTLNAGSDNQLQTNWIWANEKLKPSVAIRGL